METIHATRFEEGPVLDLRFPPLPNTVAEVSKLLSESQDSPDTPKLIEIVNHDPIMAATILRRINSVYYGMRRMVSDIRKAVFLLGFLDVSNMVLTSAVLKLREVLSSQEQVRIFEQIMRLSILAAYYGQEIAKFADLRGKSNAFTVGLIHSMGRLVLLYNKPAEYEALWCTCSNGIAPGMEEERTIFGTDHTHLSVRAAAFWNLPEEVGDIVGNYLNPDVLRNPETRTQAKLLRLAVAAAERTLSDDPDVAGNDLEAHIIPLAAALEIHPAELRSVLKSVTTHTPQFLDAILKG